MNKTTLSTKFFITLSFLLCSALGISQTVITDNIPTGAEVFVVPNGVTSITVEVWGAGGRGEIRTTNSGGGGTMP